MAKQTNCIITNELLLSEMENVKYIKMNWMASEQQTRNKRILPT